jgi:hypothetical protein
MLRYPADQGLCVDAAVLVVTNNSPVGMMSTVPAGWSADQAVRRPWWLDRPERSRGNVRDAR